MVVFIAICISSTITQVVRFDLDYNPRDYRLPPEEVARVEINTPPNFDKAMRDIVEVMHALRSNDKIMDDDGRGGIGVAIEGRLDGSDGGTGITHSVGLHGWHGRNIFWQLSHHFNSPRVKILNDAQAAALGEAHYGLRPLQDFWYVIWGIDIGGALVRRVGTPEGYRSYPSELGHQLINVRDSRGWICRCGQMDCLEARSGGVGILDNLAKGFDDLSGEEWAEILMYMASGVRNLVTIQPVELVVFGGNIALRHRERLQIIQELLKADLKIVEAPEFSIGQLTEGASIYGAMASVAL